MKKTRIILSLLLGLTLTGLASADVIFSDDFNLPDGSDVDSSKWTINLGGSSTARIDAGTGNGKADLQGKFDGSNWQAVEILSKVSGDFLTANNTVTYTAKVGQTGTESAVIFGVGGGDGVEFTSWAPNSPGSGAELKVDGSSIWTGSWDGSSLRNLSIVLTSTTYDITLDGAGSWSGSHSMTSIDGFFKVVNLSTGWSWCHAYVDDVVISQVPEPATMSLLALGGLGVLLRRKK